MLTIWKYTLEIADHQVISVPQGARLLYARVQGGKPVVWAIVDPNQIVREEKDVWFVGTGHPYPAEAGVLCPMGPVILAGGKITFHVLVRGEPLYGVPLPEVEL